MQNLIQNILDVEKYETTQVRLNLSKVSLHNIVIKACDIASFMMYRSKIQFENSIPKEQMVTIDSEFILRVFANILSNATKYMNEDRIVEVSSTIVEDNGKEYCRVNIYNSGEPIPSEKIDSVFQKYTQLGNAPSDVNYSTGIGLTFCRLAIEAHGGQIGAISGKEKGVSFWFTLPV